MEQGKVLELLTEKEKVIALKRRQIAAGLRQGWTYERIQGEFGVSTSTISLVKRLMEEEEKRWKD